ITKLVITVKGKTSIDNAKNSANIHRSDLMRFKRTVDTIIRRSQRLTSEMKRDSLSFELFAALNGADAGLESSDKLSKEEFAALNGKTNRLLENGATKSEQTDALTVIRKNAAKIYQDQPQELIKLKNELELFNLKQLLDKFREMIQKRYGE